MLTPDFCVIGAGSAGLSVAAAARAFGASVVLIEKGAMGGDCLNFGCVPSKALIAAAAHADNWREAGAFGVDAPKPQIDFEKVRAHVRSVIATIAPNDSVERFTALGARVIQSPARFVDARTVEAGGVTIRARRFVIATGSRASLPPIPGLADTPSLTNETVFDLDICPEHLIVIGGGPIGMELAQAFRRLGARATVLEAARPLAKDDAECGAVVIEALAREGVIIRSGIKIVKVGGTRGAIEVVIEAKGETETLRGTHLLVAAGRQPNIEGLGLEAAGIAHDRKGIRVDKSLRTTNRRVYAIGDVAGLLQFTHAANDHAGLVIRNALFRLPINHEKRIVPWVTYTAPELAHVGLSESMAHEKNIPIRVLRWPMHENDRAQAERDTQGLVKVITSPRGKILGATIVASHAGEMIMPWVLAVSRGLSVSAMAGAVFPYPTRSEIGKRAAISFFSASASNPWLRKLIAFLRVFG